METLIFIAGILAGLFLSTTFHYWNDKHKRATIKRLRGELTKIDEACDVK